MERNIKEKDMTMIINIRWFIDESFIKVILLFCNLNEPNNNLLQSATVFIGLKTICCKSKVI